MRTDITRFVETLLPSPDGESAVRHRTATVTTVNADGTVDLDFDGVAVDDVAVLAGVLVATGSVVQVAAWQGDLLVLGRAAVSSGELIAQPNILVDVVTDSSPNTISTTEAVEQTATVTIPTYWSTYFLEAIASFDFFESGTLTAIRTCTFRLRRTNLAGNSLKTAAPSIDTVSPNRYGMTLVGYSMAQSATGAQSVVFTTEIGGDTGQASTDDLVFSLKAFRLT